MMDFLLFSSSLALFLSVSQALNHNFSDCAPAQYTCGELTLNITYPFLFGDRSPNCGHPSFYLICEHDALMIPINDRDFEVRNVSYENYLLSVVDTDFVGQTCPQTFHNTTIDSLLFDFGQTDRNLSLYFNCTSPLDIPAFYGIGCQMDLFGRYAYYRLDNESFVNVFGVCKSTAVVPLDAEAANELQEGKINLTGALQKGFSLEWKPGNGWCSDCMNSGGYCGYDSNNPDDHTCFCSNSTVLGTCSSGEGSRGTKPIGIIIATVIYGTPVLGLVGCFIWRKKRKTKDSMHDDYSDEITQQEDLDLPMLDLKTIMTATDNFSINNRLGEGGFGPVYKGRLGDGQDIAVKRLSKSSIQGAREFKNEVILIARLQHRNLVRLLGCCIQGEEKILVYEYMPNNSLDSLLFDKTTGALAAWEIRYNIILGIARGLLYLHQDSRFRIIHRDLKAGNILLDKMMSPKISDFGMARLFGGDENEANTRRVVGTFGYMSPEYITEGIFSVKSDVFSFGVLLLEIISGKRNRSNEFSGNHGNLLGYAWNFWREGSGLEVVDRSMECSYPTTKVLRCINIGLLCVQERPEDRPTMSSVVMMLSSDDGALPHPKKPGFVVTGASSESCNSKKGLCSLNDVTLTVLDGR